MGWGRGPWGGRGARLRDAERGAWGLRGVDEAGELGSWEGGLGCGERRGAGSWALRGGRAQGLLPEELRLRWGQRAAT